MERKLIFLLFAWLMVCSVQAQPRRLSREEFRAKEQAYITAKASLTEQEAIRFFPLFFEMKEKVHQLNGAPWEKAKNLCEGSHPDAEYGEVMEESYNNRIAADKLEKRYYYKFKTFLSCEKIYQIQKAEISFHRELLRRRQ